MKRLILTRHQKSSWDNLTATDHNRHLNDRGREGCEFAYRIGSNPPDHKRFFGYPSGATTIVDFDVKSWADIDFGMGTIQSFIIPSELR